MDELTMFTDPPLELYAHFLRTRVGYAACLVSNLAILTTLYYFDIWHYLGMLWLTTVFTRLWVKTFVALSPKRIISPERKAVLVTGCDSGFGAQLCRSLDNQGFVVYAGFLNKDSQGAADLQASCSNRLRPLQVDVTNDQQVSDAVIAVKESLGDCDLWAVVNNAGIGIYSLMDWCSVETFRRLYEVNTLGAVRVTKAFLPFLKKSKGRVVNVASSLGKIPWPGMIPYCMSKSAMITFSDGLRQEMAQWDITVHTILPFLYKTKISDLERVKTEMDLIWKNEASDAVKEEYGERYLKSFQRGLGKMLRYGIEDIREVVDDLMDAVMAQRPQDSYSPNGPMEMVMDLYQSVPREVQDLASLSALPRYLPGKKAIDRE